MTVGELKEMLEDFGDHLQVFIYAGPDDREDITVVDTETFEGDAVVVISP